MKLKMDLRFRQELMLYLICIAILLVTDYLLRQFFIELSGYTALLAILVTGLIHSFLKGKLITVNDFLSINEMESFIDEFGVMLSESMSPTELEYSWHKILRQRFMPNEVMTEGNYLIVAVLDKSGALLVPALNGVHSYRLIAKAGGQRKFNRNDVQLAESFRSIIGFIYNASQMQERVILAQKNSLLADVSNVVGCRLNNMLYNANNNDQLLIKDAMVIANNILRGSVKTKKHYALSFCISLWVAEFSSRFGFESVKLLSDLSYSLLEYQVSSVFFNEVSQFLREVANNVIKHSDATDVVLKISNESTMLNIYIFNNNCKVSGKLGYKGNGLVGIQRRITSLNGDFVYHYLVDQNAFEVIVNIPVINQHEVI